MALLLLTARALAGGDPPPENPVQWEASGQYQVWNLQQNNFLFGWKPDGESVHPLDDAAYTVQLLRVRGGVHREHYGVVARMDLAQGWWGVDNDPADGYALTAGDDGTYTLTRTYNDDGLFEDKDTNYAVHVDLAYGWARFGPVEFRAGRQNYQYGHKLVLDDDLDSVGLIYRPTKSVAVEAFGAKVAEGIYASTVPTAALMGDNADYSDANALGLRARYQTEALNAELFALYYVDTTSESWAYYPNGVGYLRSRFAPQVTQLTAVGLAGDGKLPFATRWKAEADVLVGKDEVDNADHGGGMVDINDGELFGWNAYADLTHPVPLGKAAMDVGATFGMGSGDDDVTGGKGNVNKLSTQGFFFLTNVWEDSVMPDVEGITPQGLGSPATRGYREFENTTAVQGRLGVDPIPQLRLESSFTWLAATQPIHGFDATGVPTGTKSTDLGWEVDANAIVKLRKGGVVLAERFGYFQPGEGASLLVTGTNANLDAAWELRSEAQVNF